MNEKFRDETRPTCDCEYSRNKVDILRIIEMN